MITEFDIYLRNGIHECDVMIHSLPYRDGITATSRMVIESCIKNLSFCISVAQRFNTDLSAYIDRTLKTCYEKLDLPSSLVTSDVDRVNVQKFFTVKAPVKLSAYLKDLYFRITSGVNAVTEIAADVIAMEIHFSFGRAHSGILLNAEAQQGHLQKFASVHNMASILADAGGLIYYHIAGVNGSAELTAKIDSIVKRHRMLSEVDESILASIDEMTMDQIDYVILT